MSDAEVWPPQFRLARLRHTSSGKEQLVQKGPGSIVHSLTLLTGTRYCRYFNILPATTACSLSSGTPGLLIQYTGHIGGVKEGSKRTLDMNFSFRDLKTLKDFYLPADHTAAVWDPGAPTFS